MNKTDIELRKVYLRMKNLGKPIVEIHQATGVNLKTLYSWKNFTEEQLLSEPSKSTRKPTFDIEVLQQHFQDNPLSFNKEVAEVIGKTKSTIQRWRHKLGFTRKKVKTTYKDTGTAVLVTATQVSEEADDSKKNSSFKS
jgi:transposase